MKLSLYKKKRFPKKEKEKYFSVPNFLDSVNSIEHEEEEKVSILPKNKNGASL